MRVDLNDYFYFVYVVEKKGYSSAARFLNMPKSRLSRHISKLEERLGLRLLQRTPRNLSVTQEGWKFYKYARELVDVMVLAEASVSENTDSLRGQVTFSCSTGIAQFGLIDILLKFSELYPNVTIEQRVSNNPDDLILEGLDFSIRGHSSDLPDSALISKPVTSIEWPFVCSPRYLNDSGVIKTPDDLCNSKFLKLGRFNADHKIALIHADDSIVHQKTNIALCTEDMMTLKRAVIKGLGVASLPEYVCHNALKRGDLVRVLPEWVSQRANISLLMPSRLGIPKHTSVFIDYILDNLPLAIETKY
jgi:DNA-binding transcriptional LysR family regulator